MNNSYKAAVFPRTVPPGPSSLPTLLSCQLFLGVSVAVPSHLCSGASPLASPTPTTSRASGTLPPGIVVLPFSPGVPPGGGAGSRILSASHPQAPRQHCFRPGVSHSQSQTVSSGLVTYISLQGAQNSSTGLAKGQPLLHPSLRFSYPFFLPFSTLPFPSTQAQSSSANQLPQTGTCRGPQPPRSTVSRGWYELSREEPWAQGRESKVKHHIFPNHFVMWERSGELLGLCFGACAIEGVLPI